LSKERRHLRVERVVRWIGPVCADRPPPNIVVDAAVYRRRGGHDREG